MASAKALPIPATKLRAPPPRPESILRGRLQLALQAAIQRPLTVIRAPAGYGKTTVLIESLERPGLEYAWLSLDSHDNDPQRFAARVLAALGRALPGRLDAAEQALHGGSDLRATVIPLVVDALAKQDERLVMVLDDYQAINNRVCHELTRALVDTLPATASLVIASRTSPPLRLAQRRAAETVSEIGPEQLRFTPDETMRLLNGALGLALSPERIELIDERLQGWGAGLALIGAALAGRRDRGEFLDALARSRASLEAYLTEEVLDGVRPRLREFLRRTSILTRLSASLCAAVLDDPRAPKLLDEVRRMGLFITALDREGTWFRYHHAFTEALSRELQRREPQLVGELHGRACDWFERAGMVDEAIDHALLAGDAPRAVTLLAANWGPLVGERRHVTMRRILDRLSGDLGELGPLCEALDIDCMVYEGVDVRIVAERALRLLDEHGDDPPVRRVLDGVLISPFYGDVGRAVQLGREAWRRYARDPDARSEVGLVLALVLWFAGEHAEVRALLEPRLEAEQPSIAKIWTLSLLSLTAADEEDPELAERYARQAMGEVEAAGAESATETAGVPVVLAEALRLRGQLDEARRHANRGLENEARRPGSVGHAGALIFDARLALAEGDRRRASRGSRRARKIVDQFRDLGQLEVRLAEIETALEQPVDNPLLGTLPTPAEARVLRLLDSDLTFPQIAAELQVSRDTVKSHAHRLYRRLGQHSRADAVAEARKRGLLADE